ncbi:MULTISPECIES: TatD family hydrolase [unclassified Agarivorans]|uniref:TatD family hydrolase n=1 Tax=unclassified Agarivorans TaxID=2636026 RepID=UPI0026E29897|nr:MULTISPECIES: TatD family hydrolase [unclassified Agarivorans]MDO6685576.1 TatD family hydrolase [Agarivorans sp. 3_MG-2023]MDO6715962.1 TatD family hydrolase [Agarivorans sp. 2_MG-2023]
MFDIALNLTSSQFDKDRTEVVERAQQSGINGMLLLASDMQESQAVSELALQWPNLCYATAGVHPHDAKSVSVEQLAELKPLLVQSQVVAVGECGLDFNRDFSPRPQQEAIFEAQLALAAELHMPVVMHERDAHQRFIDILTPWRDKLPGAVLHCFTSDQAALKACLDLDIYIGITGWVCDERRGQDLQQRVTEIPDNRLLLETDAPYLLPRDLTPKPKSRRNEPCYLGHIYQRVADLRQQDVFELQQQVQQNAKQLFQL